MARKWWTLLAVCTGVFMLLLDITIVNVALPYIQQAFHASLADLQWVIDAYALTLAAFLLTAGSVADLVGRRLVFAIGIVVFTIGSALCGVAGDPTFLALSRAFQGIGGAIMFATSLALLADAFPPRERGVAFGVFGAVTGVAVAVGPVLGGALTSWLSWRWIFFVNVPIGVFALAVTLREVAESKAPVASRPDWAGFVTFTLGLTALVYGLIRSHPDGWGSTTVIGSLTASVVLLAIFLAVEVRSRAPMLDLKLLRVPTFNGGLVAAWAISASIFSLLTYMVLYLQNVLGSSAIDTGVRLLPFTGAIFLTAGLAGRLTGHVQTRFLIAPGFVLIGAGLVLMRGHHADRRLDPSAARDDRRGRRLRPGQRAARVDRGRRRRAGTRRDGLRDQLDVPPDRDRHRRGRAREHPRHGGLELDDLEAVGGRRSRADRMRSPRRSATAASCRRCTRCRRSCAASRSAPPAAASSTG